MATKESSAPSQKETPNIPLLNVYMLYLSSQSIKAYWVYDKFPTEVNFYPPELPSDAKKTGLL